MIFNALLRRERGEIFAALLRLAAMEHNCGVQIRSAGIM
jgi:hypothetical protein